MSLFRKYNIPVPRYTSYPTVPHWETPPTVEQWKEKVKRCFDATNSRHGISLYIHLPYCESLCTYCACNTRITVNHQVEEPYISTLLKEWNLYLALFDEKPRLRELHLGGGTPTFFSPGNLEKLLKGIYSGCEICTDAEFSFEGHPANTSAQHLQTLYNCGFRRVSFGIQDFDEKVQEAIHRFQDFEQVERVTQLARETGYESVNFDLVYGLPFQTLQSINNTLRKVNQLRPERIAFYSYAHVPWIKPGQRKFTEKDLPADDEKRALYEAGLKSFSENGYQAVGMDHFALPGDALFEARKKNQLHRNFMGYTARHTKLLIGLGCSSISDTWDCFAQNLKTIEDYTQAVNKNEMPVFKGHVLNETDLYLRKHILNIMCQEKTSWNKEEPGYEAIEDGLKRAGEIEEDGLVQLNETGLEVTSLGQAFLRNICSCFDQRLHRKIPETNVFSSAV